jgi:AraC family transcriptional regulator, positive regulator of tynA and feaB
VALAAWKRWFSDQIHEIEVERHPNAGAFSASHEQHTLGNLIVNFTRAGGSRVIRTPAHIAASCRRDLVLFQPRAGMVRLRNPTAEFSFGSGECVLINTGQPYEFECSAGTSAVALTLPHTWLKRWLPRAESCPTRFDPADNWNQALCGVVGALQPTSIAQLTLSRSALAESIATLIALAAGPNAQGAEPPLFDSLIAGLRASMHESDISPAKLAERHDISLRTLCYAFAHAGTTFRDELMRLRMERAGELLSAPSLSESTILEVAVRCGFTDPSHFARRFRLHFGRAPREFRLSANVAAGVSHAGWSR